MNYTFSSPFIGNSMMIREGSKSYPHVDEDKPTDVGLSSISKSLYNCNLRPVLLNK